MSSGKSFLFLSLKESCRLSCCSMQLSSLVSKGIAWALSGVRFRSTPKVEKVDQNSVQNVLLISLTNIGDVVNLRPFLKSFRQCFPRSKVTLLSKDACRTLVRSYAEVDECEFYTPPWLGGSRYFMLLRFVRVVIHMRRAKYDLAIVTHPKIFNNFFCSLLRADVRVGFTDQEQFFNFPIAVSKEVKPACEYPLDLLRGMGFVFKPELKELDVDEALKLEASKLISDRESMTTVALHLRASVDYKGYDLDFCACLLKSVLKLSHSQVELIGSKDDAAFNELLIKRMSEVEQKRITNRAGAFALDALAAFLSNCDLYIGLDSGPMHIADALNLPVLALFRASDPKVWGPIRNSESKVFLFDGSEEESVVASLIEDAVRRVVK